MYPKSVGERLDITDLSCMFFTNGIFLVPVGPKRINRFYEPIRSRLLRVRCTNVARSLVIRWKSFISLKHLSDIKIDKVICKFASHRLLS